jgi:hypothetical protein
MAMRLVHAATLLALALAACDGSAPPAQPAGIHAAATPAPDAGYPACRDRAGGDVPALTACADDAIAKAGSQIDSPEAAAAFRSALRQFGDAAAGDGGQAAQAAFAHRAVRLAHNRAALLSGSGVGDAAVPVHVPPSGDAGAAWARSRMISCREHPVPACSARYDALLGLTAEPKQSVMAAANPPARPSEGLPLPRCIEVQASPLVGSALADAFYARYPRSLAGEDSVESLMLDPAALDNVVHYLVCMAGATDYDPVVAENGLALFASHRHGAAALRALDSLGRSRDPAAEVARRFRAQIDEYLKGPGD